MLFLVHEAQRNNPYEHQAELKQFAQCHRHHLPSWESEPNGNSISIMIDFPPILGGFLYCTMFYIVIQFSQLKGELDMGRTITVRLNSEEEKIYREYAEFKNIALSTLMKEALKEKIEDEIDLQSIFAYEERLKNNEVEYISFDEVKKRLKM